MCLVREEIQNVDRERQLSRTGRLTPLNPVASLRQGVPRKAVAFLKVSPLGPPPPPTDASRTQKMTKKSQIDA